MMIDPSSKITRQIYEAKLDKNGIPKNMGLIPLVLTLKQN
jgi:hypothetical protein